MAPVNKTKLIRDIEELKWKIAEENAKAGDYEAMIEFFTPNTQKNRELQRMTKELAIIHAKQHLDMDFREEAYLFAKEAGLKKPIYVEDINREYNKLRVMMNL